MIIVVEDRYDKVVVFGINGTINREEVRKEYEKLRDGNNALTGLVTTQMPWQARAIINEFDLDPEFSSFGLIRIYMLYKLSKVFTKKDLYYVGNTLGENISAELAGWNYVWAENCEKLVD